MSVAYHNSILYRFFLLCAGLWRDSLICRWLDVLGRVVPRWFSGSTAAGIVRRDGAVLRAWPDSLFGRALCGLFVLPTLLLRKLYRSRGRVLDHSLVWRLLSRLGSSTVILTGLFLAVMLSIPHSYWNNVYGFVGALVLTLLFLLATARGELKLRLAEAGPWFCLFLASIVIALFTSWSVELSVRFFLFYVGAFLLMLLVSSMIRRTEQLMGLLCTICIGVLAAGVYGVYQLITGVEVVYSQQDMLLNQGMPGRIFSFFDNPNNFAEILVMLLPLALALLLCSKNTWARLLALAALATGIVSLGATYSRSGWIGTVVAVLVFLALVNWKLVPMVLLVGILCIPLLPATIFNRLLTIGNTSDTSTTYRFYIYDASFTMLKDYWFQGTGLGTDAMTQVFRLYPAMKDGNFPLHTHNNYLQMWGELGILGGIFHLGTMLGRVKQGIKGFRLARNDRTVRLTLAAAVGALCGIMVVGLAEYTWYYPRNLFIFWVLFGLIGACLNLLHREPVQTATE